MCPLMHGSPVKKRFSPSKVALLRVIFSMCAPHCVPNPAYLICDDSPRAVVTMGPLQDYLQRVSALNFWAALYGGIGVLC